MPTQPAAQVDPDQLRVITRVAWLYHVRGLKQSQVADTLGLSQSRVSRLLESAVSLGIVRTTVRVPTGLQLELEQALVETYGLRDAHVFDVPGYADDHGLLGDLGRVLADYLVEKPLTGEVVGFTSWSRTLRETIRALEPPATPQTSYVVEMLGDVGPPEAQHEAAEVTRQLARLVGAQPRFLRVPGVVPSARMRRTLLENDAHAREALTLLDRVDEALVGIGSCAIDPPLRAGDNFFTMEQFAQAQRRGAVGQVNLRFIDADGAAVTSALDDLVIGVTLEQLRSCARTIAVGGGPAKVPAIRGALRGGWVNTLVTDTATAEELIRQQG
jgi:DNA-binding transcriptional regulator LsrR (DeoR family)